MVEGRKSYLYERNHYITWTCDILLFEYQGVGPEIALRFNLSYPSSSGRAGGFRILSIVSTRFVGFHTASFALVNISVRLGGQKLTMLGRTYVIGYLSSIPQNVTDCI